MMTVKALLNENQDVAQDAMRVIRAAPVLLGAMAKISHRSFFRMSPTVKADSLDPHLSIYEEAVRCLNSLQSNVVTLSQSRERRETTNVPETVDCLHRIGIEVDELDSMHIIHMTGTKGKGSTCAYVEKMLRSAGYRTGFFSSPHMVHVRERIRLDGEPLSEEHFARRLLAVFDRLKSSSIPSMPAYFKFLTVLAFQVFLEEKVDVAIIEVGIGGEFDCTNVIRRPEVVGVATLDLDHTALLGCTIPEIAWNKAGIFKPGTSAFISSDVTEEALEVIRKRAKERECSFSICPPFSSYEYDEGSPQLGISGVHQELNASLALQMTREWIERVDPKNARKLFPSKWTPGTPYHVPSLFTESLATCFWPGRSQILKKDNRTFYLDGAHTVKSIQMCADWFSSRASPASTRVLIFHCTGDRQPSKLLRLLMSQSFSLILFCPPVAFVDLPDTSDGANFYRGSEEQNRQAERCRLAMEELKTDEECASFPCVSSALSYLSSWHPDEELDVLVTGSLILVGASLSILDPSLA